MAPLPGGTLNHLRQAATLRRSAIRGSQIATVACPTWVSYPYLSNVLECARRQRWIVRTEDTAFEQRASLKARGYRWDDGEGKRVKAWWLMTNDPQTELDWLRADIYGDDRHVTVLNAPATRRYSARLWAG